MKKVISTKHCSTKQMENMAHNLRKKFKEYCSVDYCINFNAHVHVKEISLNERYTIYIVPEFTHFKSWQELQQHYYELIKGG